jgi:hypothetical protein
MSHLSISTTEAEPPFGDQPPEDDLTLDLEEPGLTTLPPEHAEVGDAPLVVFPAEKTDAFEETLDLSDTSEVPLVGSELQKGKYRVLSLHPGSLGVLQLTGASYTALHTDLQKRLTLRYLPLDPNASAVERNQTMMQFLREVRALAKLGHPGLPRVHDYFCEGAACYVVMDELSKRTLADVLADAAQEGRVPALPPLLISQVGLELVRAVGYLHQQRPPLVLGGLRAQDIALPEDGPAQLMSLGALSMVASVSSGSLPGFMSMPTLPVPAVMTRIDAEGELPTALDALAVPPEEEETLPDAAPAPACLPGPGDDLYSLGQLLCEMVGGVEVVARVMDRLQRPDEAWQADRADDAPPISLALAGVIQIAAHDEPGRRFQSAAAFETALTRAWMVERRIARQAERGWRDERATRLENGEVDLEATALDMEPPEVSQHREMATRIAPPSVAGVSAPRVSFCWRCSGHNLPNAPVCRVCGARQPIAGDQRRASAPRRARATRRLPSRALEESSWSEWGENGSEEAPVYPRRSRPTSARLAQERRPAAARQPTTRPLYEQQRAYRSAPAINDGRRLLWGLVWTCFVMAFVLGAATFVVTYLALR